MNRRLGTTDALFQWAPACAGLLFLVLCLLFISHGPGLQYDEALSVRGAVNLASPAGHATSCFGGFDVERRGRCWPLMIAPYVGAVKDYAAAPLFRLFGTRVVVARLVAALFGVIGIVGCAVFFRDQAGAAVGAAFALVMAVEPTYLDQVLFDNGNVAVSMGFVGLLAFAGNQICKRGGLTSYFALGLVCGVAVWGRLNFLWIIAGLLAGIAWAFPWRRVARVKAVLVVLLGAAIGAGPLWFYHWQNPSALQAFVGANSSHHNVTEFLHTAMERLQMVSEVLFSDREHREIWRTGSVFSRGTFFYWVIAPLAGLWCLLRREASQPGARTDAVRWMRSIGCALLVLLVICLTTQLRIAEHHLVVLIPFIAACMAASLADLRRWGRFGGACMGAIVLSYVAVALWFDVEAAAAIHRTRGLGMWSDAINAVNESDQKNGATAGVNILDWGLQANLFFLSGGVRSNPELFWGADEEKSDRNITWADEVGKGGRFLTTAPLDRAFPAATSGFEKALQETRAQFRVQVFPQQDGKPYALLYTVAPKK